MSGPKVPTWKKAQQEAKARLKGQRRTVIHYGASLELGVKAFKRANPNATAKEIREFKDKAWKSFDARKVEVKPKPTKFEVPKPHNYQLPEGLSNHQKLVMRQAIRQQIKEAQGGKVPAKV